MSAEAGKRKIVVAAAREVFLRHGFARTTMGELAQAAGMSRPALYLVFPNKEQIFAATFAAAMERRLGGVRAQTWPDWPLHKKLLHVLQATVADSYDAIRANPMARDLLSIDPQLPGVAESVASVLAYLVELLRDPVERSSLQTTPEELARMLLSSLQGFELVAADGDDLRRLIALQVSLTVSALQSAEAPTLA